MPVCRSMNLLPVAQIVWTEISVSTVFLSIRLFLLVLKGGIIWMLFIGSQVFLKAILKIVWMKQYQSYYIFVYDRLAFCGRGSGKLRIAAR